MKKTLILIVVIVMLLTLPACGQPSSTSAETAAPVQTEAPIQAAEPTQAPVAAPPSPSDVPDASVPRVIGLSLADASDGWEDFLAACAGIAEEETAELRIADAGGDAAVQQSDIEGFLSAGCRLLIIQCVDAAALHDTLVKARADGIRVVAFLSPLGAGDWDAWYRYDDYGIGYAVGEAAGSWLNETHEGKGHVGIFEHPTDPAMITRVHGIRDALSQTAPEARITATAQCTGKDDAGEEAAAMLSIDPELVAFCSYSDTSLLASLHTIAAARRTPSQFGLFGAGGQEEALRQIAGKSCYKSTVCLPGETYAADVMDLSLALLSGESGGVFYAPFAPVTTENVEDYLPD